MVDGVAQQTPATQGAAQGGGLKYDTGKTRIELFPGDALFAISQVLTFGANKYASRNWEQGISWGRVFGALQRHLWAWWQGRGPTNKSFLFGDLDAETSMSHLWHAGCCIIFLIAYEMRDQKTFDDRPAYQKGMPLTQGPGTGQYEVASKNPQSPQGWPERKEQMDPIDWKQIPTGKAR